MAKHVFVLTALLVVLMAAGRAGMYAGSSLDGPIIPMPLAEATGPHPDLVTKSQPMGEVAAPANPAAPTGEIVSSMDTPGTAFKVLYLFQYDSAKPGAAQTKDKPLSVILWKALPVGAKAPVREVRERMSENSASGAMTSKAIYALQSDYRLQKLALPGQDIDHLFELLQAGDGEALAADATWKGKIASQLKEVEWLDDGTHKNKKNKQGKDLSAKAGKGKAVKAGKSSKATHAAKPGISKAGKASKSGKVAANLSRRASKRRA